MKEPIIKFNAIMPKAKGNWFNIILANMLAISIVSLGLFMPLLSVALAFIVFSYMQVGIYGYVLNTFRDRKPDFESMFLHPKQIIKILIIKIIAMSGILVWGLLLVVPGIIYGLNCSFAGLVYFDNPTLSTKEIFEKSKALTYGCRFAILVTVMGMIALVCSGASIGVGIYYLLTLFTKLPIWLTIITISLPAAIVLVTLALPMFESFLVQMYQNALVQPEKPRNILKKQKNEKIFCKKSFKILTFVLYFPCKKGANTWNNNILLRKTTLTKVSPTFAVF